MLSLDDGLTWVDAVDVVACRIVVWEYAARRKATPPKHHRVQAHLRSGTVIDGEDVGTDAAGMARAVRILAALVKEVG